MPKGIPGSRGVCSIPECGKPHLCRGWCGQHYGSWRRYGDPLGTSRRTKEAAEVRLAKAAARTAEWRRQNLERANRSRDEWTARNPDRVRQTKAAWSAANAEMVRARTKAGKHRRRALLRAAPVESFLDREIFDRDNWVCGICGTPIDPTLTFPDPMYRSLDHIIPICRGGGHVRSNVQAAHLRCNKRKNGRLM